MVMDVYQDHILVTYRPFDVHIFHVKLFGELTPHSTPDLQVNEHFPVALSTAYCDHQRRNFLFFLVVGS